MMSVEHGADRTGTLVELVPRPDYREHPGGDVHLVQRFAEIYTSLGFRAKLAPRPTGNAPLVHLFNIDRLLDFSDALWRTKPDSALLVTPLHHAFRDTEQFALNQPSARSRLESINRILPGPASREFAAHAFRNRRRFGALGRLRHVKRMLPIHIARTLTERAAVLLPNSRYEEVALKEDFPGLRTTTIITPNIVSAPSNTAMPFERRDLDVLIAARIEPRKNQLKVLKALGASDLRIALVGSPGKSSSTYAGAVLEEASRNSNVTYNSHLTEAELREVYARTKVSVSASYFEAFSLVDCEAMSHACQVVASSRGGASTELLGAASIIDPYTVTATLQPVVERLITAGTNRTGQEHMRNHYSPSSVEDKLKLALRKLELT